MRRRDSSCERDLGEGGLFRLVVLEAEKNLRELLSGVSIVLEGYDEVESEGNA